MVIQCKNLISLYILPDQRRVNLRYFDFDQNRLWGATSLYSFSFSLHFTRSTTGESASLIYKVQFYLSVCVFLSVLTPLELLDVQASKLARLITTPW